jgi:tRNA(Ile)-lysidine synthase
MLVSKVRAFIRRHDLIPRGARVLAAVSGGSDSIALAHILLDLDREGDLQLAGIVHLNHQLRSAADTDEQFVRGVAAALERPFLTERADVAARARQERRSIEDAARSARYEWFERARLVTGADLVALGHTRDDQAETVLLRMTRGAGPRGLSGMYPRHGSIVRPLLGCRREELRAWLAAQHLTFVDDETNGDVSIPRNRVRAELLPLLIGRFNPSIVDVLADEADLARDAWLWMDGESAALASRVVRVGESRRREPRCELDVVMLAAAPVALQRLVLWRAMREVGGSRAIAFQHVEAARQMLTESGGAADFPGQRAERIGGSLVLRGRPDGAVGRRPAAAANLFQYSLSIPGEVIVPDVGVVSVEPAARAARAIVGNGGDRSAASVRADLVGGSLVVRNRRPGDRFRPAGLGGGKKLQDYFVDRKVARDRRDAVPIIVDEHDRIVWVAGYEIDEAFRVTDGSQPVLLLKFKALGGSA